MKSTKLFQITEEDKAHYKELIDKIDPARKDSIIKILGIKIQTILDEGNINAVEAELIEDITHLVKILELHVNLPESIIKRILFAMSYFIDENDEIPILR